MTPEGLTTTLFGLFSTGFLGAIWKYIVALLIFFIGKWIAGKIRIVVERLLLKTKLDNQLGKYVGTEGKGIEKFVGSLVYSVLLLFIIIFALEQIGLTGATKPLKDMLAMVTTFLPRVLGAGVLLYLGHFFAKLVKGLTETALQAVKLDERASKYAPAPISKPVASVVYGLIMLAIIPAAFGALEIPTIQKPLEAILGQVTAAIPNILLAGVLVGVGFYVSKIARSVVESALQGLGADTWPAKLGFQTPAEGKSVSSIAGLITMVSVVVLLVASAIDQLNIGLLSTASTGLVDSYWGLLTGVLVLGFGLLAAAFVYRQIADKNLLLAKIARVAIIVLSAVVALKRSNIAPDLTNLPYQWAVYALFTALGIGGAIAIGLGGKDYAKRKLDLLP